METRHRSALELLLADPLFAGVPGPALARLVGAAEPCRFEDGDAICRRGSPADAMFLVASGRVRLDAPSGRVVRVPAPGRCGEEAAVLETRVCDAVAEGTVEAWRLPREAVAEFATRRPSFAAEAALALAPALGGEAVVLPPRRVAPGPGRPGGREAAAWLSVVLLPALVFAAARGRGLAVEAALFAAMLAAVVIAWATRLVEEFVPPVAAIVVALFVGLAPPQVALGGFASPTMVTLLGVFALSAAIARSGLSRRVILRLIAALPDRAAWHEAALLAGGALLSPVTPSGNARFALLLPLQRDLADGLRLPPGGAARTALVTAGFAGAVLFSPLLSTSRSSNLAAIDLLPSQVRDEFRGIYWLVGAFVAAVGLVAVHLFAMRRVFPAEERAPLPRDRIEEQLRSLGPATTEERFALAGFAFFLLGTLTQSWHHVPPAWLAGIVLVGLLFGGILGRSGFREAIDWPMLFFLLGVDGLVRTMSYLRLDAAFAQASAGAFDLVGGSAAAFVVAAFATTCLVRFALPIAAGALVASIVLVPVAEAHGLHPWVAVFLSSLFADVWFLRYQSSAWMQAVSGEWAAPIDESLVLAHNRWMTLGRVAVAFLSIPWWRWLGLL